MPSVADGILMGSKKIHKARDLNLQFNTFINNETNSDMLGYYKGETNNSPTK